jgi:mersacidin/lichenicidin family type 2 lantibiotic
MAIDITRAWKDPEYRKSLTPEELSSLPPNPAGTAALTDEELGKASGGLRADGDTGASITAVKSCSTQSCCGGSCAG